MSSTPPESSYGHFPRANNSNDTSFVPQNVPPDRKGKNGLATWGLVFAVLFWPVGLFLSILGFRQVSERGAGKRRAVTGIVISTIIGLVYLGNLGDDSDTEDVASSASASADADTDAAAASVADDEELMADWTGKTTSAAEDAVEDLAGTVVTKDASIEDRSVFGDDWVVCSQSPAAGEPYEDVPVIFRGVQIGETCISEEEQTRLIAERDAAAAAEETARTEQLAAEQAAREAEDARVPVLDQAARDACSVLAANAADVTTDQDRSDFAAAFNASARQSSEPKIVEAGEFMTSNVDSWTGFLWDGSVAVAAEVCLDGGAG